MGTAKASTVFLAGFVAAFVLVSLITIYGFDYYEGALGSRLDNALLSAVLGTAVALVVTTGFATVLRLRGRGHPPYHLLELLIAAAVACGLVHALPLAGEFMDRVGSWQIRLGIFVIYSVIAGVLTAVGMIRVKMSREHAA
jgi:hypothetical protein